MLNKNLASPLDLYKRFSEATPFKHICIDNFLDPQLAKDLFEQFPSFDRKKATNEFGTVGGKATQENIRNLGPAYRQIDDLLSSPDFLSYLSRITGIQNILYDAEYFGGGTHENLHGQELDVHIDFNYHRSKKIHRRLNLIVYLNPEWDDKWGGEIEVHSNPREPEINQISAYAPFLNRCVMFETNEYSWHGFPKINLPEDKRHLSRKSFAVYFYTEDRPAEEIAPPHKTFYVQRPISNSIQPNKILSPDDYQSIRSLIRIRDQWITYYQNLELNLSTQIESLKTKLENSIVPLEGFVKQTAKANGFYEDGWLAETFQVNLFNTRASSKLRIKGYLPEFLSGRNKIVTKIDGQEVDISTIEAKGLFSIEIPVTIETNSNFNLEVSGNTFNPLKMGLNEDSRDLSFSLKALVFE